jgi:hypothetical protein
MHPDRGLAEHAALSRPVPKDELCRLESGRVFASLAPHPGKSTRLDKALVRIDGYRARFKQPKAIEAAPDSPHNTVGRAQKTLLSDRFAGVFAR